MRIPFLSRPETPAVERRRQRRISVRGDSYARVDGRDIPLVNWSEEGFLAGPYSGGLIPGQRANVRLVVRDYHDRDGMLDLLLTVVIKRIDGHGVAARIHRPERYKRLMLKDFYALKLASGRR